MKDVEVRESTYEKINAPGILYSGPLTVCIAVGAIHGKVGYLAHCVDVFESKAPLEALVKDLKQDTVNSSGTKIYIAGGGIEKYWPPNSKDDMKRAREEVLISLERAGFKDRIEKIEWRPAGYVQALRIIPSEGRAELINLGELEY